MLIDRRSFIKTVALGAELAVLGDKERAFAANCQVEHPKQLSEMTEPEDTGKNKFRVMAVQFCGRLRKYEKNVQRTAEWAKKAAEQNCDLVLFPELSVTGYCNDKKLIAETAQTIPGPATQALLAIAEQNQVAVCAGITEAAKRKYYISQVTALPDGTFHLYRKRFGSESCFAMGESVPPFSFREMKIGVAICMDSGIYELHREYAFAGTNLLLKPNSAWQGPWLDKGEPQAEQKAKEHRRFMDLDWERDSHFAASNAMVMICCNTVGDNGNSTYPGGCWFSDGTLGIKKSIPMEFYRSRLYEKGLVGEIEMEKLIAARKNVEEDLVRARIYYNH